MVAGSLPNGASATWSSSRAISSPTVTIFSQPNFFIKESETPSGSKAPMVLVANDRWRGEFRVSSLAVGYLQSKHGSTASRRGGMTCRNASPPSKTRLSIT